MIPTGRPRPINRQAYAIFFALFAFLVFLIHGPWLKLPYFWDEAGFYIPSALDVLHGGWLIPHSVSPLMHPPGVPAYLALFWKIAGYHALVTRSAMLAVAALAVFSAFLLTIELSKETKGLPAFLVAALVLASPVFYSQALLAQLDMPAMALTTLALLLFLQDRFRAAALVCIALVLAKETGLLVPLCFIFWLGREKRWRQAAWFAVPVAVLAIWVVALILIAGHWAGSPGNADYNLFYPLNPMRLAANLARRVYYLFFANLHWVGAIAIWHAWRKSELFRSRAWQIAGSLAAAHVALVTLLGGAVLERYLLPALPVLYAAMAAGLSLYSQRTRWLMTGALLAGVVAGNFINPPYPFPYENNLSFTTFTQVQADTAEFLELSFSTAQVSTAWPLTAALGKPEMGYVSASIPIKTIDDFAPATLRQIDWRRTQVFVAFSRDWNPEMNAIRTPALTQFFGRFFRYAPQASEAQIKLTVPFPLVQHIERGEQWADVYVNPETPLTPGGKVFRAVR